MAVGIFEYVSVLDDEVSIGIGDTIKVLRRVTGWCYVQKGSVFGWAPSGCLEFQDVPSFFCFPQISHLLLSCSQGERKILNQYNPKKLKKKYNKQKKKRKKKNQPRKLNQKEMNPRKERCCTITKQQEEMSWLSTRVNESSFTTAIIIGFWLKLMDKKDGHQLATLL